MTKGLLKLLAALTIAGATFITVNNIRDKKIELLESGQYTTERVIQRGDTYWGYAKKLREKYPQLKEIDIRDLTDYLRENNNWKELIAGEKIKLPEYSKK